MNDFLKDYLDILKKNFSNPYLELRILLNNCSIKKKNVFLSNFNINDIDLIKFNETFQRRLNREPISKIFNKKSFWKYDFYVNMDVLDPRPETELIIEKILNFYPDKTKSLKFLDMCTGSGCIAISLAKEYAKATIDATDISSKALIVAKNNAKRLNCSSQINFIKCDILKVIQTYDIVVSNPPYLSNLEYKKTVNEIQLFEPKKALVAPKEGFYFYYKIAEILPRLLKSKSMAFLEIGSKQAEKVKYIFSVNNLYSLKIAKDIQNLDRLLIIKKS
jgi:release factor glutamine methyltransferase